MGERNHQTGWDETEGGSGEREAIKSTIRPRTAGHGLPKLWDDDVDDGELTGPTDLKTAARRAAGRACLTIMTGVSAGQVTPLDDKRAHVLGRSRSADVLVQDTGVSRLHCRIVAEADGLYIEDAGSRNGTLVNGSRIRSTRLSAGDRIQIGDAVLQFDIVDEAEVTLARNLFEASTRDPLTRAYNRRYFMQRLEAEVSYARRHGTGLGVLLLDLDHFKSINDTSGHAAGDAVLRGVVEELGRSVRAEDLFTRYGGEEFAILTRVSSTDELRRLAERVRARIEAMRVSFGGSTLMVTVSIGSAEIGECTGSSPDDLLGFADRRLYRAKLLGRNRVCSG